QRLEVAAVALCLLVQAALGQPVPRKPREPDGFAPMYKVLARKPDTTEPYLRAWWEHRDRNLGVAYAVGPRRVPMHLHLHADHVITVIEGDAMVTVGGAQTEPQV